MTNKKNIREKRYFTDDFKRQMVQLYQNGKKPSEIVKEYDLTRSALTRWISECEYHDGFGVKHTRSDIEKELIALRKEHQRVLMENDILKQAALIMGRK